MHISRIRVPNFRVLKNIDISFEEDFEPRFFPLASTNGGGKSTLLQLVFVLLHCSSSKSDLVFIKNILESIKPVWLNDYIDLLSLEIKDGEQLIDLQFKLLPAKKYFLDLYKWSRQQGFYFEESNINESVIDFDFQDYIDHSHKNHTYPVDDVIRRLQKISSRINNLELSQTDENKAAEYYFSTQEKQYIQHLKIFLPFEDSLYLTTDNIVEFKKNIGILIRRCEIVKRSYEVYKMIQEYSQNRNEELITSVKVRSGDLLLLICESQSLQENDTRIVDFFKKISNRIYLLSSHAQIFLFSDIDTKRKIFKSSPEKKHGYFSDLQRSIGNISGLYMHDTIPVDGLLKSFKLAQEQDFKEAVKTDGLKYGNSYNKLLKELDVVLPEKKVRPNHVLSEIIFKRRDEVLYPEDLSHGELRKLGVYLWMRNNNIHNSVVLIDELEIGLHPDWQYQIVNDLITHFPDNQYIVATHSYDICEAVTPAHVKELSPEFKLRTES